MIAKEYLRIGNLIETYGKPMIVGCIAEFGISGNNIDSKSYVKYSNPTLQPMQLTEEWLLKFGFNGDVNRSNYFNIKGMSIWKCNDLLMCDKNGIIIRYVHQLQNLYYALTGDELQITS